MSEQNVILLIIVASLVISLNLLSLSVFSALMAGSMGKGHGRKRLSGIVLMFLITFVALLGLLGVTLIRMFNVMTLDLLASLGLAIATGAVIYGLVSVKDFFWYNKRPKLPGSIYSVLHSRTVKQNNLFSAANLGLVTAFTALGSMGIQLLCLIAIFSMFRYEPVALMLIPALCIALPLLILFILVIKGTKISAILKWKEDTKNLMRLNNGLVSITLGWILFLILNGSIGSIL
jgi:hypothetical protein